MWCDDGVEKPKTLTERDRERERIEREREKEREREREREREGERERPLRRTTHELCAATSVSCIRKNERVPTPVSMSQTSVLLQTADLLSMRKPFCF